MPLLIDIIFVRSTDICTTLTKYDANTESWLTLELYKDDEQQHQSIMVML